MVRNENEEDIFPIFFFTLPLYFRLFSTQSLTRGKTKMKWQPLYDFRFEFFIIARFLFFTLVPRLKKNASKTRALYVSIISHEMELQSISNHFIQRSGSHIFKDTWILFYTLYHFKYFLHHREKHCENSFMPFQKATTHAQILCWALNTHRKKI